MRIEFNGAVALITGAASGIGRAAALAFAAAGARVAAADRDEQGLASLREEIRGLSLPLDVTDDAAIETAVARAETALGPIGILVTAAGILQTPRAPDKLTMREWDRVMAVNLRGTYRCCAVVGAGMAVRGHGAIVTISSIMGLSPGPVHAYAPAKAAIINLTQSLAAEWAGAGVRVNGVAPGFTQTPALGLAMASGVLDRGELASASAQTRLVTPEEVAAAILFLASPLASGITGVTLPVDGGTLAAHGTRGFDRATPAGG